MPKPSRRRAKPSAPIDPAQVLTINEFCAHMKISRATYYRLVERGAVHPMPDISPPRVSGAEVLRITSVQVAG